MAKTKAVAQIGYGPYDRVLINAFSSNKNAEEASLLTGGVLTPAQCLDRIDKLIRSKDVLDVQQRRALIVDNAYELAGKLKAQIDKAEYIGKDEATTYLKTLRELLDMVERSNGLIEEQLMRFTAKRAVEFTDALSYIFNRALVSLIEKHPEIELEVIQLAVEEAIPESLPQVAD